VLREAINKSIYCNLQTGCRVIARENVDSKIIVHCQENETERRIKTQWLIGADGKTGIVRKKFLEPVANVQQITGLYEYTGTWIAANLKITPPIPETHPELGFWKMGISPEEVYDLFWPENWHFCSPPGKATASGRFGPRESRLWRHELAEPDWDDSKDAIELMWEHLTPMITRGADRAGRRFEDGDITFPRDCIEILRCRPFTFAQKVVNKWFHDRTILIGDAAHVFPPFGGQGIACGVRDADALAWRLALLLRIPHSTKAVRDEILHAWSSERRQGFDDSTKLTMVNGRLCNNPKPWGFFIFRQIEYLLSLVPGAPNLCAMAQAADRAGYKPTKNGFFLSGHQGGGKMAQVYVKPGFGRPLLSDELLRRGESIMTILVLNSDLDDTATIRESLCTMNMPRSILSEKSIIVVSSRLKRGTSPNSGMFRICQKDELKDVGVRDDYDDQRYLKRFSRGTVYAIVRPDLIVFAACKTIPELEICMRALKKKLGLQ
jgi:2-polyprenyl-6-methoxyphenol hydroxylase-like FAD-dependent oxidoreductase